MQDEFEYIRRRVEETKKQIDNMEIPEVGEEDFETGFGDALTGAFPQGICTVINSALKNATGTIQIAMDSIPMEEVCENIEVTLGGMDTIMESVGEIIEEVGVVIEDAGEIVEEVIGDTWDLDARC